MSPIEAYGARETYTMLAPQSLDEVLSKIDKLQASQKNQGFSLEYHFAQFPIPSDRIDSWGSSLANLTSLHLTALEGFDERYYYDHLEDFSFDVTKNNWHIVLKLAANLEELQLNFLYNISMEIFDDNFTWRRLKRLSLFCMRLNEVALLPFFRRHGVTLEELTIDCCEFIDGPLGDEEKTWINFLQRARKDFLICLKSFQSRDMGTRIRRLIIPRLPDLDLSDLDAPVR